MIGALLDNTPKEPTPLVRAIGSLGVEVIRGEWNPDEALLRRLGACLVGFGDCLGRALEVWRLKRRLARHGVPLVVWNRDAPGYLGKAAWRLALLERAELIDLYASHSLADGRRFARTQILLPNAAQTEHYHLGGVTLEALDDPARYRFDVGFFGALCASRVKEYRARVEFFAALAPRLAARGIRLSLLDTHEAPLSPPEQRELIQRTRVNLNFGAGCDCGVEVGHGLPERCFGVPACGGFLLSDRRLHAAQAFEPGTEWADFEGLEDALAKIERHLANFAEARKIARRAHARVLREHTYRHRALALLEAIGRWREAARRAA